MIRLATTVLNSCYGCPYLDNINGYSTHFYKCLMTGEFTGEIFDNEYDDQDLLLKNWFENLCPLPTDSILNR